MIQCDEPGVGILREAPEGICERFVAASREAAFQPGEVLIHAGSIPAEVGFVESGTVRVFLTGPDGHDVTLYRVGPGSCCVLAVSCVLGQVAYPAMAVAEDSVRLRWVNADLFRRWVDSEAWWRQWVFRLTGSRLASVLGRLEETTFQRVEPRLADLVLRRLPVGSLRLHRTHEQLALDLGSAREVISRILGRWRRSGWIRSARGFVEVLNRAALERAAAS